MQSATLDHYVLAETEGLADLQTTFEEMDSKAIIMIRTRMLCHGRVSSSSSKQQCWHETGPRDDDNKHDQWREGHRVEDGSRVKGNFTAGITQGPREIGNVTPRVQAQGRTSKEHHQGTHNHEG
jgi:hypothetical protein